MSAEPQRYELALYLGPCSETEAEAVADAIVDLPEFRTAGGGGISVSPVAPAEHEQGHR